MYTLILCTVAGFSVSTFSEVDNAMKAWYRDINRPELCGVFMYSPKGGLMMQHTID